MLSDSEITSYRLRMIIDLVPDRVAKMGRRIKLGGNIRFNSLVSQHVNLDVSRTLHRRLGSPIVFEPMTFAVAERFFHNQESSQRMSFRQIDLKLMVLLVAEESVR